MPGGPFTFTASGSVAQPAMGAGVVLALSMGHGLGWAGRLRASWWPLPSAGHGRREPWLAPRSAASALAGFLVGIAALGLRAQLFGVVLFAAVLAILAWRERRPRLAWAIPLLVLAWANIHGSFFLGPAAVALALVEDLAARRPVLRGLLPILGLSVLASCVTPFGPGVWGYALGIATNARSPG